MTASRTILHADMDAFYASVEQRDDPALRGRPVIVGGLGRRGVVATASYEARRAGVHSAMPTAQARRLCPGGVFLRPRMEVYVGVSRRVRSVFESVTDRLETLSLDEAFLDVTGSRRLLGDGRAIAERIRAQVRAETGLAVSVGVASSKFVAKVASELAKPDGLLVVPPGSEVAFLGPLPVARLWGAGPVAQARLARAGLATLADIQHATEDALARVLGQRGARHAATLVHGRDTRPVESLQDPRSVSRETTFDEDVADDGTCRRVLLALSEDLGWRLRRRALRGRTLHLKLRFPPFQTHSRQVRLAQATDEDLVIYRTALGLFEASRPAGRPVRLLGVGLSDLQPASAGTQRGLFEPEHGAVTRTLDAIRQRFGDDSVRHAGSRGAPSSREAPP